MATFDYREPVAPANLLPAVAAGVALGIAAGYVANLLLRRSPLPPGGEGRRVTTGPPRVPIIPARR